MDFCSTAVKELSEELGVTVEMSDLRELFKQRIYQTNVFHGKTFIDNEFNTVYALEMDCEIESIQIQPEEVSEVLWMNANDILAALDNGTSTICANSEEVKKAISILQNNQI
jgi:isopentenyldiphosphate isomerase